MISNFQKYLSVWVILCMVVGILIGTLLPSIPTFLDSVNIHGISIPIAVLIWIMIYPMMLKIDFDCAKEVKLAPKGLLVTWVVNWAVKPFTMYAVCSLFLFYIFKSYVPENIATEYLAGAVILGAAPCTAMVFVWSSLTKGNPVYTIVQVATNDLIILVAFVPIVKYLLGISEVSVPYSTLIVSVLIFVVIPMLLGIITRKVVINYKGKSYFESTFIHKFDNTSILGLLLTLVIIFTSQTDVILSNPFHIILIAIPLIIQTVIIFLISYLACKVLRLPHEIAAPAGLIGASNFFELAVAVTIALFGATSPAALATTVGVLTEVPIMLFLCYVANKTKDIFTNA